MNKLLEISKSFTAVLGLFALTFITIFAINSMNPVGELILSEDQNAIAGVQNSRPEIGDVKVTASDSRFEVNNNSLKINIEKGLVISQPASLTFKNTTSKKTFINLSAETEGNLKNKIRIELTDANNKILLSDFNKNFDSQTLHFNPNQERTFQVKYILSEPLNYSSEIYLNLY